MAKKYRLSKDEQSQPHGIMPCFTFVVVEFVFIEVGKISSIHGIYIGLQFRYKINPALQHAIIDIPVKLALKCYLL
jgi:hypothetical protein